jgi:hypothetical protein
MMSSLVRGEVERAGLVPVLDLRGRGIVPDAEAWAKTLEHAPLLALGAAADFARRRECGDPCRIWPAPPPGGPGPIRLLGLDDHGLGTAFVRAIATMRLLGPIGLRIVFDLTALGLDLAEVALSFGVSELAGRSADPRRVDAFVRRAGYSPSHEVASPCPR